MDQHDLLGTLAESLCRLTADAWEHPKPVRTVATGCAEPVRVKAGSIGSGQMQSAFLGAGYALAGLGVVEFIDQCGRASSWRFLVDGAAAAQFVAERSRSGAYEAATLEKLAIAWIDCATHFGLIDTRRMPFTPSDDMLPVMQALANGGYTRIVAEQFLWNDAIGRVMRHSAQWNDDNLSHAEVMERENDIELAKALETLPDDVRDAALEGNVLGVQIALCNRWSDGEWQEPSKSAQQKLVLYGGIERAKRFVEMIVDDVRPNTSQ
jgi:hypothetical protein